MRGTAAGLAARGSCQGQAPKAQCERHAKKNAGLRARHQTRGEMKRKPPSPLEHGRSRKRNAAYRQARGRAREAAPMYPGIFPARDDCHCPNRSEKDMQSNHAIPIATERLGADLVQTRAPCAPTVAAWLAGQPQVPVTQRCKTRVSRKAAIASHAIAMAPAATSNMASSSAIPAIRLTTARGTSPGLRRRSSHSA